MNRLDKSTGHWTYDGITVYGPPAPGAVSTGYTLLGPHQQPPQDVSNARPAVGYHAPGPYVAIHPAWHVPPSAGTAVGVPETIPAWTPGITPVFV